MLTIFCFCYRAVISYNTFLFSFVQFVSLNKFDFFFIQTTRKVNEKEKVKEHKEKKKCLSGTNRTLSTTASGSTYTHTYRNDNKLHSTCTVFFPI